LRHIQVGKRPVCFDGDEVEAGSIDQGLGKPRAKSVKLAGPVRRLAE
jgi:hypothetical protein